jgi:hypothetical protein
MALQDTKKSKLVSLGYSGSMPNMERAFYLAEGASGTGTQQDLEKSFLSSKGYAVGALPDRWKAYLVSLGYSGHMNHMMTDFWTNYTSGPPQLGFVNTGYVLTGYYTPE